MRLFKELGILVSERRDPMEPDRGTEQYNQKINTWNGIFKAMALRLVNPFLGINLIRLGAPNIDLGILDAVPSIAGGVVALLGTPWLSKRRDPHRTTMHLFLLARGFYLVFALIDVLAKGPGVAATWMLLAIVAMDMPSALATLSWQSMTTQMFSARTRVTAVMWRQWGMNLVGLVTVIIGGVAISSDPSVHGYIVLYTVAAIFGFVEVTIYRKFRVTGMAPVVPGNWVEVVPRLMKQMPFRRFVIAGVLFYFGWLMLWPVALRYQVSDVHATNGWMAIYSATNAISTMVALPIWRKMSQKTSAGQLLAIAAGLMAITPFIYSFSPSLQGIIFANITGGLAGAGLNLLLFVRLMEVVPEEDRLLAVGANTAMTGLAGAAGALSGVALLAFGPVALPAALSTGIRILGAGLFFWSIQVKGRHWIGRQVSS
ncbi:MAG: MFS transporter [Sulfobacillus benefaciens]|uniref:MFS transporter n=1 Tax=Sulfobacillus benefaciens TaxID=453960 RepID=A0A2T2XI86_9FIRM|nr:MAG: MFS transporter [Sulfobacillus benefaciens]